MADYQTLFEDPRTIDSLGASGFTEAELAGMRSAGIILLVTGSITAASGSSRTQASASRA